MNDYKGLDAYLSTACKNKDASMIRQWRLFVNNVLYPLDKEASDYLQLMTHPRNYIN